MAKASNEGDHKKKKETQKKRAYDRSPANVKKKKNEMVPFLQGAG